METKKKKNTLNKGKRAESLCKAIWKENGWLTEIKNWNRWTGKDFFGMFDFIAIKGFTVEFIQVKTNQSDFNTARREISKWLLEKQLGINVGVWLYIGDSVWLVDNYVHKSVDKSVKTETFLYKTKKSKIDENEFKNKIFVDNINLVLNRDVVLAQQKLSRVEVVETVETLRRQSVSK